MAGAPDALPAGVRLGDHISLAVIARSARGRGRFPWRDGAAAIPWFPLGPVPVDWTDCPPDTVVPTLPAPPCVGARRPLRESGATTSVTAGRPRFDCHRETRAPSGISAPAASCW